MSNSKDLTGFKLDQAPFISELITALELQQQYRDW